MRGRAEGAPFVVHYLTTSGHQYPWRSPLEDPGAPVAMRQELLRRVRIIPYERLFQMRLLPPGPYVFADLDRLDVEATERAALLRRVLQEAAPGIRLFNDPIRSMRRFELLRHLYGCGLNDFNVYRLADIREVRRFPVFLRAEDGHEGSLTPLLHDSEQLERAIDEMVARGKSRDNKLIVEYVDCRDDSGMHQKFGALFVGSQILQATRGLSQDWIVKDTPSGPGNPPLAARPRPDHEARLLEILRMANIDYGRIDYALVGDRIQVFEINTNPTIWPPELLLTIARTLDEERTTGRIAVSVAYRPPWKATYTRSYYVGRVIHRILRGVGMMRHEDVIVDHLRRWKRRLIGPTPRR